MAAPCGRMRCFVGLPLPESWQAGLARVTVRLSAALASPVRWTRPGNWHLTLKFLGDVEQTRVPALVQALGVVTFAPFALRPGRAGFFPPLGQGAGRGGPRVLWAGLAQGAPSCVRLAAQVDQALEPLGLAPEARPFAPHLTLGRVKAASRGDDWGQVERAVAAEAWPEIEVSRFTLWRSVLGPGGPEYQALAEFPARAAWGWRGRLEGAQNGHGAGG